MELPTSNIGEDILKKMCSKLDIEPYKSDGSIKLVSDMVEETIGITQKEIYEHVAESISKKLNSTNYNFTNVIGQDISEKLNQRGVRGDS